MHDVSIEHHDLPVLVRPGYIHVVLTRSELCSDWCDNTHCAACVAVCTVFLHMGTSQYRLSMINISDKLSATTFTFTMTL